MKLTLNGGSINEKKMVDVLSDHNYSLCDLEYKSDEPIDLALIKSLLERNKTNNVLRKVRLIDLVLKSFKQEAEDLNNSLNKKRRIQ